MRICFKLWYLFIFFAIHYSSYGLCVDPVKNQFLVTTKHPTEVISLIKKNSTLQKLNNSSSLYIYNHDQGFKTQNKVSQTKIKKTNPLLLSTLLLRLTDEEKQKISLLPDTHIESDCYAEIQELTKKETLLELPSLTINSKSNLKLTNDPLVNSQWALEIADFINTPAEINFSKEVIVAVSDTGFDYEHEDLKNQLWRNDSEINGQAGIDDDRNGCIDDFYGCDVADNDGDVGVNTYRLNLYDHGTHVAGIIGAERDNNLGITGAAHNVKLMLVKAFSSKRRSTLSDLLRSIYYAVDNGAEIINCSWGVESNPTLSEFNSFEYARRNNVLVVVASGNSSTYASHTSPGGLSNVLSVGSINSREQLSTFSNFGDSVDILAPGGDGSQRFDEKIKSLSISSTYSDKRGTSMAAPYVSATLANLKSAFSNLNRNQLSNLLLLSSKIVNVEAYFDPQYKGRLALLNNESALRLALEYQKNPTAFEDLNKEPKKILTPDDNSVFTEETLSSFDQKLNSSSGCGNNSNMILNKESRLAHLFFLFMPLYFLFYFKKKSLKK